MDLVTAISLCWIAGITIFNVAEFRKVGIRIDKAVDRLDRGHRELIEEMREGRKELQKSHRELLREIREGRKELQRGHREFIEEIRKGRKELAEDHKEIARVLKGVRSPK